jgi:hypothetical protein
MNIESLHSYMIELFDDVDAREGEVRRFPVESMKKVCAISICWNPQQEKKSGGTMSDG